MHCHVVSGKQELFTESGKGSREQSPGGGLLCYTTKHV